MNKGPKAEDVSQANETISDIARASLKTMAVARHVLKTANEGIASYPVTLVMLALIEGNKTSIQVRETSGLDKAGTLKALRRLRKLGLITPSREPESGATTPPPVYSLADPDMVMDLAKGLGLDR